MTQPPTPEHGPTRSLSEATQLALKLRDLLWRVDQVRAELQNPVRAMDDATLAEVLDTRDLKALLEGADHGLA
ncbi:MULTISPECIES: hypothetical protein [Brevundimonas]|uniref:hypothetical protein n=1 Tax=Brevundimonas TaxID=41275 RepID=UPI0011789300|nr:MULTISPECIES: hypothetical protein [Brevundimonas]MBN9479514.1 hypothetical protein [Bordetella sp.]